MSELNPILKWPGGKRWFKDQMQELLPRTYNNYIEPFLGSASIFFDLLPQQAILGDLNEELIDTYSAIKEDWEVVYSKLRRHHSRHSKKYYYQVRDSRPTSPSGKAARMIYLNRTCFNGIYRVNLDGQFNVPIGTKTNVLLDTDDFQGISEALSNAVLLHADFEDVIAFAQRGDLVFADPPYTVRHNLNGFVKYNEKLFSWNDQKRLASSLDAAKKRGAHVISTNAYHNSLKYLYRKSGFSLKTTSRYSSISADSESRKQFQELVILSKRKTHGK